MAKTKAPRKLQPFDAARYLKDDAAIAEHPYVANAFTSLWDARWQANFTQHDSSGPSS